MLTVVISLFIAGLVELFVELKRAVSGYEDEFGFHEGVEPALCGVAVTPEAVPAGWTIR